MRGGTFEQTLVLLNGININDPQTGHHNTDFPVDLDNIDRIEILKGPASRAFGANAFSGAVNIITNEPEQNKIRLTMNGGANNYYSLSVSGAYNVSGFNNFLSISKKKSDGYIKNTDFDLLTLFYSSSYAASFAKFDCQVGYMDKAFGANSFYSPDFPDQFESTKTIFASLKSTIGSTFKLSPVLYWRRHQDRFELFRDNPPSWYTEHNYHLTDVYGININNSLPSVIGITNIGAGYRSENILSNKLGIPMNHILPVPGEPDGKFTNKATRDILDFFLEHNILWKVLSISGGLLADHTSEFNWNIYAGVDASYMLFENSNIFANVNNSFRLPSFTELYYSDPTSKGNPQLQPEKAISYEFGLKYLNDFLKVQLSIFRREGNNLIDWTKQADDSLWRSTNLTNVNSNGLDIYLSLYPENLFKNSFPIHNVNISYSYLSMDKIYGGFLSEYVLDYLRNKLTIVISHDLAFDIKMSWSVSYNDRAGQYLDYQTKNIKYFKPYFLVDTKIYTTIKNITIYLLSTNLFDVIYTDIANLKLPGRWLSIGVNYDLNL
ncbi:MAG: hypothetical protein A2X61_01375 [Ignavibacteria bacterium GWB2_35_12]|nr:MAG: hypothetical protein A2X63_05695 [Ignavibacteria bacterium GWA2_35_8]OGU41827.1 MAG: hypothetical protein A2X61_01375 [Ignavibacteria bacterium GWB2_35_12]OGU95430.1 MAG: hypothetical protein A2220_17205 [Ignavibacteria bacterium RIFOXYA2_FULL_35_10]OGV23526.1 MAG: hypothetical protein A2475_06265 [Ignavibacteria bacterium RIFOXYC2_FULL_35_21]